MSGHRAELRPNTDVVSPDSPESLVSAGPRTATAVPPTTAPPTALPAAGPPSGAVLRRESLHASVSDPVLDTMNFLNEITLRYPRAISFAPGRPCHHTFDLEQVFSQLRRYLEQLAERGDSPPQIRDAIYQYGPTAGQIRELIAASLRDDEDIDVPPEAIVVTVGSQEAMLVTLRALIREPADTVVVASPCYVGITGAARLLDATLATVDERDDGLRCADLDAVIRAERAAGRRPRACYLVPDHANPSGATMPRAARGELLDLAARHDILILEDSPYRLVSPGPPVPTLKSLDRGRRVIHLGSYSKTLFPGARVGYVVADQPVVGADGRTGLLAAELTKIKSMVTVNTSSLSQAVVGGALVASRGRISDLNAVPAERYGRAMRSTLQELARHFPEPRRIALGLSWNTPTGGFFLTLRVPFRADEAALARSADEFGVIWTPMAYFYPAGGGHRSIRLSISYLTDQEISQGIARLARFIEAEAGRR